MSQVSNVFLFACEWSDEEFKRRVEEVNSRIEGPQGFLVIGNDVAGGDKCLEMDCAVAAFNYVGARALREAVEAVSWWRPESVQVLYCGQEDDHFEFLELNLGLEEK